MLPSSQSAALIKPLTAGVFEVWQDPPRNTLKKVFSSEPTMTAPRQSFNTTLYCEQPREVRIHSSYVHEYRQILNGAKPAGQYFTHQSTSNIFGIHAKNFCKQIQLVRMKETPHSSYPQAWFVYRVT